MNMCKMEIKFVCSVQSQINAWHVCRFYKKSIHSLECEHRLTNNLCSDYKAIATTKENKKGEQQ